MKVEYKVLPIHNCSTSRRLRKTTRMECLLEQTIWLRRSEDNDQLGFVNFLRRTEVRFCPKFVNKREPNLSAPPVYRLDVIQPPGHISLEPYRNDGDAK